MNVRSPRRRRGSADGRSRRVGYDGFAMEVTLESVSRLSDKLDKLAAQVGAALPADLVALRTPGSSGPQGFCRVNNTLTNLQVHVSNQGTVGSPASTTHVDFANNPGVDMATPPLAPGGTAVVEFAIPASCYDASNNCHFTITVDSTDAVVESNGETNNAVAGVCGALIQ
jgi:subtilase family serine protease